MSTITENRQTATQMIERMRTTQSDEERGRLMKTFLVQYANYVFVRLPEKKQKAAALMAYAAIDANPSILRCEPSSIIKSVAEAALYDLQIGGVTSHAYLIPYGRDAKLQIGYKGLIELCRRAGQVKDILVEEVRPGDKFDCTFGDDARIEHKPAFDADRAKRPITHVYAVIRLLDGGVVRRVFSTGEIDQIKEKHSKGWQRAEQYRLECIAKKQPVNESKLSPWHTAWLPMAKKTVLRAMINGGLVPIATEARALAMRDEDETSVTVQQVEAPRLSDIIPDVAPEQPVADPQVIEAAPPAAAPEPPKATEPVKVDNTAAFKEYVERLSKLDMVRDAEALYLNTFSPHAETPWTAEEDATAKELMESHCNAIKAKRGGKKG